MWFSRKIKVLLVVSIAIIILAVAANEGSKTREKARNADTRPVAEKKRIPYPFVPADIDQSAIDKDIDSANVILSKPKPAATNPIPVLRQGISAEAYLVADLNTGEVYSEYNQARVFPIASVSKLVTALVVLHFMQPDQKLTVTQPMLEAYGDAGHLMPEETFTTRELLYPLLLESSNDAAEVFAQSYDALHGPGAFVGQMNAFAKKLGMTSTSFQDASGLSAGNASSPHDLFLLSRYLYASEQPLLEVTRKTSMTVATSTEHAAHTWSTINPFPLDPHFLGGKTGRTNQAKESMISLFRYAHGGKTYSIAIIVLRSDFKVREIDSSMLFEKFIQKIQGK